MPESTTQPAILPAAGPEPFTCPFKRQCLTREVLRWLLPAILAWALAHTIGCTGSLSLRLSPTGVGIGLKWEDEPAAVPTTRPTTQPA